jgi:hypothetical protein
MRFEAVPRSCVRQVARDPSCVSSDLQNKWDECLDLALIRGVLRAELLHHERFFAQSLQAKSECRHGQAQECAEMAAGNGSCQQSQEDTLDAEQ